MKKIVLSICDECPLLRSVYHTNSSGALKISADYHVGEWCSKGMFFISMDSEEEFTKPFPDRCPLDDDVEEGEGGHNDWP